MVTFKKREKLFDLSLALLTYFASQALLGMLLSPRRCLPTYFAILPFPTYGISFFPFIHSSSKHCIQDMGHFRLFLMHVCVAKLHIYIEAKQEFLAALPLISIGVEFQKC